MFYFPLTARRAAQRRSQHSSRRPQLEGLEDRLVPNGAPPNGTILFTNWHAFDNNPSPPPPGTVGVEPNASGIITGVQTPEAVNGSLAAGSTLFQEPSNLFEDPINSNVVYVTDDGNFTFSPGGSAAVLKVDFSYTPNPKVTIVSQGSYPTGVVVIPDNTNKEWLYVTDTGNVNTQWGVGYVLRIDPDTGAQTRLAGTVGQFKWVQLLFLQDEHE